MKQETEDSLNGISVKIEMNTAELLEKTKRLQQLLEEAEILMKEIGNFELVVEAKI